jgi:hypothetical protein
MTSKLERTSSQLKTKTCRPNVEPKALTDSVLPVPAGPYLTHQRDDQQIVHSQETDRISTKAHVHSLC